MQSYMMERSSREKLATNVGYGFSRPTSNYDGMDGAIEMKDMRIKEAAAMYGDYQTAEELGYLTRGYAWLGSSAHEGQLFLTISTA